MWWRLQNRDGPISVKRAQIWSMQRTLQDWSSSMHSSKLLGCSLIPLVAREMSNLANELLLQAKEAKLLGGPAMTSLQQADLGLPEAPVLACWKNMSPSRGSQTRVLHCRYEKVHVGKLIFTALSWVCIVCGCLARVAMIICGLTTHAYSVWPRTMTGEVYGADLASSDSWSEGLLSYSSCWKLQC